MITVRISNYPFEVKVDGLVNRGKWFGKTWLLGIGEPTVFLIVEGDCEQDALDFYADSKWSHLTKVEDNEEQEYSYIGNFGKPHDLFEMKIIERCRVNYFVKKEINNENL